MDEIEDILDPMIDLPDDVEMQLSDILPRGYLSVSQISTLLKCPYSWYLRYVEGRLPSTSARMFQGVQVHGAVEKVLTAKLESGRLPPVEFAVDAFSDAFDEQKALIEDWEGDDPGKVKDIGVACTRVHYQEVAPSATPLMVEKTFHTSVLTSDGKTRLPLFGRIDSIQVQTHTADEYEAIREKVAPVLMEQQRRKVKLPVLPEVSKPKRVHDLKVVTDKWSPGDLENDIQFALYAGVEKIPDVQVDQIVKGRAKTPRPRYEQLTGIITDKQVQHALKVTEGVAKTIGLGHFPLTDPGNWWCSEKWCSSWRYCRGANK
jgi:hypothetical protein